ncbi:cell division protein DivIVA, partial [Micromonospora sp. ATA51]|nr:cell division protein DivIVA [Micromonospora sp. ATA51]
VVPVAAPVDQEPADRQVPLRPPADPTASPAADAPATDPAGTVGRTAQGPAGDDDDERERGAVVRSESA